MSVFLGAWTWTVLLVLSGSTIATAVRSSTASSYFSGLSADEKLEYTSWLTDKSSSYPSHAFLVSNNSSKSEGDKYGDGAALFWNVNGVTHTIHFAIVARATGWVGLGISDAGGMLGADMALFEVASHTAANDSSGGSGSSGSPIRDAHVVDSRSVPIMDDCQDWKFDALAPSLDGWIILELHRALDTDDAQDRAIVKDADLWSAPTRVIAAWGDEDSVSYHGTKSARGAVRIYASPTTTTGEVTEMQTLLNTLETDSDGYFDIVHVDYEIPAVETTYTYLCKTYEELNLTLPEGQNMVTMIGAVPIIDKDTAQFIHHFTVHLTNSCNSSERFESLIYRSLIYLWAPGNEGMALPSDVGFPLFDSSSKQAIDIQIHYHNPTPLSGMKDTSGLRFYYTNEERAYRAGILETGDPWVMLNDTAINAGLTQYSFTCPGTCSSTYLTQARDVGGSDQGVTILSETLHMHKTGVRMTNEVIRGGEVFHTAVADVYDFDQQGGYLAPQEAYEVVPGDSFRTTCYYENGSQFGLGSDDEMCIAFLLYYPAQEVLGTSWQCAHRAGLVPDDGSGCSTELEYGDLEGPADLGRSFGTSSGACGVPTDDSNIGSGTTTVAGVPSKAAWFGISSALPTVSVLVISILVAL